MWQGVPSLRKRHGRVKRRQGKTAPASVSSLQAWPVGLSAMPAPCKRSLVRGIVHCDNQSTAKVTTNFKLHPSTLENVEPPAHSLYHQTCKAQLPGCLASESLLYCFSFGERADSGTRFSLHSFTLHPKSRRAHNTTTELFSLSSLFHKIARMSITTWFMKPTPGPD